MLSIPDMALLGAAALLLFGPEQLPNVLRKVGQFSREVQNTSQSFIREMERAAESQEVADAYKRRDEALKSYEPPDLDPPDAAEAALDPAPHVEEPDVAEPDPHPPAAEKLAEPRPAPDAWDYPTQAMPVVGSVPAEPPPEPDHPAHV
ncbi:hypothetical protein WPS_06040 [Vulcanimicrobium alpinum]|uniref:Sec-independent protein translocase protein TatB n=1 Tax=Vulcanimicrobium alpinum TaxID=3016050 RepID=A0AAN1XTC5_UNVUL|nr:twin-arginine translocase TatA/TatE family subunit [Vulcanimicrobium alpinum]BDE05328.1 hypothetical protein WPS_06040 [Vulcanimicrobium alpinum]